MDGVPRPGGEPSASSRNSSLIRALSDAQPSGDEGPEKKRDIISLIAAAWVRFVRPLRDFGFGRKSIWEGGVGLFIIGGVGALSV